MEIKEPKYGQYVDYVDYNVIPWTACKICEAEYKTAAEAKECEGEHFFLFEIDELEKEI